MATPSNPPNKLLVKRKEFEAFLGIIKNGQASHWVDIARTLGVSKDTITDWKKLPEAKQAISDGITHAVEQMQTVGKRDWRMWESKHKMLTQKEEEAQPTGTTYNTFIQQNNLNPNAPGAKEIVDATLVTLMSKTKRLGHENNL